ncbi:MAG: aminopeptidase P family protein [Candidatus Hydrogenedentes bacterium]|nr:aminopeptidase P family protein [Candidatus Hydrogenedentota bacterium]
MKARLDALRGRIENAGCDALVSMAPPINQYLTGFSGSTSAVLVTAREARFFCDFRYTEQAGAEVWDGYHIEEVADGLAARLGRGLADAGCRSAAFEPDSMTVRERQDIEAAYSNTLTPAPALVSALRCVKDPAECDKIRAAQSLAEGVLADLLDTLEEGLTERELAAAFEYEFKTRGATGASFDTIALFGARSSLPHGQPGDRALKPGDVVLLDFGCRLAGYCSDLTRTYAFGTMPAAWFNEIYDLTLAAQQAALGAARAGMTCRELDAVARRLIAEAGHGDHFGHGLGHGVGIEIHEAPRVSSRSEAVLEPGTVITIEPGIYIPGQGGVRIEDLVVVTEDGCRNLTTASKELRILGL